MKQPPETGKRRAKLVRMVESLSEAGASVIGRMGEHLAFRVRKKTFGYYLFDHHGDGRIALWSKAAPGEQGRLVGKDPRRFFAPAYLGPRGWVGVRLDLARIDWNEIAYLLDMAYRMSAPRSLLARSASSKSDARDGRTTTTTRGRKAPRKTPGSRQALTEGGPPWTS